MIHDHNAIIYEILDYETPDRAATAEYKRTLNRRRMKYKVNSYQLKRLQSGGTPFPRF